jgi:hypothetical protein
VDYNAAFGMPSTIYLPKYSVSGQSGVCAPNTAPPFGPMTIPAGIGTNNRRADPQFVDPTRTISNWDNSKGGPGTEVDAGAKLMANPALAADLVSYIRASLTPQDVALQGTGRTGVDIGAVIVQAQQGQPPAYSGGRRF